MESHHFKKKIWDLIPVFQTPAEGNPPQGKESQIEGNVMPSNPLVQERVTQMKESQELIQDLLGAPPFRNKPANAIREIFRHRKKDPNREIPSN
ncbi:MAG: hypothetical protein K2X66_00065 [Cyanobacteria bacterium]|nr:hypothetical protein [Cyanobacteriota bacterium]